jgi:hypothetical protein
LLVDRLNFNLIAVWAMNDTKDVRTRYVGQVYSAINRYADLLNMPTIIIGDFNWNAIWDTEPSYLSTFILSQYPTALLWG